MVVFFCNSLFGMKAINKRQKTFGYSSSHLLTLPKVLRNNVFSWLISTDIIGTEKNLIPFAVASKITNSWVLKKNRLNLYAMNSIDPSLVFSTNTTCRGHQFTLLHAAVKNRNRTLLSNLLRIGLDQNIFSGYGHTPLVCAVEKRLPDYVKLLLEYKANTEIGDLNGFTPLFHAVNNNDIQTARILCDAGARTDGVDRFENTLLMVASDDKMIEFLKEKKVKW